MWEDDNVGQWAACPGALRGGIGIFWAATHSVDPQYLIFGTYLELLYLVFVIWYLVFVIGILGSHTLHKLSNWGFKAVLSGQTLASLTFHK